jgi:hypothetical protein
MQHFRQHDWSGQYDELNRRQRDHFDHWNGNSDLAFDHSGHNHAKYWTSWNHRDNSNAVHAGKQSTSVGHFDNTDDQYSANFQHSSEHFDPTSKLSGSTK